MRGGDPEDSRRRPRAGLPEPFYEYYAGGAGDEQTVAENVEAWRRVWLRPRGLVDVRDDRSRDRAARRAARACRSCSRRWASQGAAAPRRRGRGRAGGGRAPGSLQCLATRSTPHRPRRSPRRRPGRCGSSSTSTSAREVTRGAAARARAARLPARRRDDRPRRPRAPRRASAAHFPERRGSGDWARLADVGRARLGPRDVGAAGRRQGRARPPRTRARRSTRGAEAVVVSNHGGRQLDGGVPTAVALREVVAELAGAVPVLVDGGIRSGADVVPRARARRRRGADRAALRVGARGGRRGGRARAARGVRRGPADHARAARLGAPGGRRRARASVSPAGDPQTAGESPKNRKIAGCSQTCRHLRDGPNCRASAGPWCVWRAPPVSARWRHGAMAKRMPRRCRARTASSGATCCARSTDDEPCATFRPDHPEGLRPPQQLRFTFRQERRTHAAWAFPTAQEQAALHR